MIHGVAIGDLHLDKLTRLFGLEKGNELIIKELEKPLKYAVSNSIPNVFFMGDTCHKTRMSYDAHKRLLSILHKYDGILNIHIILGNHDWDEEGTHALEIIECLCKLKRFSTIHVYSKVTTVSIDGVSVTFLPYPYTEPDVEGPTLCFGHFEVQGAIRDNGTRTKGVDPVTADKYILGHLHTPHDVGNKHYVGTLFQTNFGESLPKSFTEFKAKINNGKLVTKYVRVNNEPDFKLVNLSIENKADLSQVSNDENELYRLIVSSEYTLPEKWLDAHPNVIKHDSYSSKVERDLLLSDSLFITDAETDTSIEDILPNYLSEKYDASDELIEDALLILEEARNNISQ